MVMMMMMIVIKFQKHTNTKISGQNDTQTRRGFHKRYTFTEITSAIQTTLREISVAIVLQNQAINIQRVPPLFDRKIQNCNASVRRFHFNHGPLSSPPQEIISDANVQSFSVLFCGGIQVTERIEHSTNRDK
jgi:hypothetical protein